MKALFKKSLRWGAGVAALGLVLVQAGCAVVRHDHGGFVEHKFLDPAIPSHLETVAIESADITSAANQFVGRVLANPKLSSNFNPPTIVVSAEDFVNETGQEFNLNALADLVRNELVNAADGRVIVPIDEGPTGIVNPNYVVGGRLSRVAAQAEGINEAYTQILFLVVDPATNQIVLSDIYGVKKASAAGLLMY